MQRQNRKRKRREQKVLKVAELPRVDGRPGFTVLSKAWWGLEEGLGVADDEAAHGVVLEAAVGCVALEGFSTGKESYLEMVEKKNWWVYTACKVAGVGEGGVPSAAVGTPFDCLNNSRQDPVREFLKEVADHPKVRQYEAAPLCLEMYVKSRLKEKSLSVVREGVRVWGAAGDERVAAGLEVGLDVDGWLAVLSQVDSLSESAWDSVKAVFTAEDRVGEVVALFFRPTPDGRLPTIALQTALSTPNPLPPPPLHSLTHHIDTHPTPTPYLTLPPPNPTFILNTMTPDKLKTSPTLKWHTVACYLTRRTPFIKTVLQFAKTSPVARTCFNLIMDILSGGLYQETTEYLTQHCAAGDVPPEIFHALLDGGHVPWEGFCSAVGVETTVGKWAVDVVEKAWGEGDGVSAVGEKLWKERWWQPADVLRLEKHCRTSAVRTLPASLKWFETYMGAPTGGMLRSSFPPLVVTFDLLYTALTSPETREWCIASLLWDTSPITEYPIGSSHTEYKTLLIASAVVLLLPGLGPVQTTALVKEILAPLTAEFGYATGTLLVRSLCVLSVGLEHLTASQDILDLCIFADTDDAQEPVDGYVSKFEPGQLSSRLTAALLSLCDEEPVQHAEVVTEMCSLVLAVPTAGIGLSAQTYLKGMLEWGVEGMAEHVESCLTMCCDTLPPPADVESEVEDVRFQLKALLDSVAAPLQSLPGDAVMAEETG